MMRRIVVCIASLVLSAPVWAQEQEKEQEKAQGQEYGKEQQGTGGSGMAMDPEKMGPWTRKPTNESKTKKEIEAFFKEEEDVMKKRDVQAALNRIDFPSYWVTDDSKGVPKAELYERKQLEEMMTSMFHR